MSKKAAEHRRSASEHHTHAAPDRVTFLNGPNPDFPEWRRQLSMARDAWKKPASIAGQLNVMPPLIATV